MSTDFRYCSIVGMYRQVVVCEFLCKTRKEKKPLPAGYGACSRAINQRKCPVVNELYPKKVKVKKDERTVTQKRNDGHTTSSKGDKPVTKRRKQSTPESRTVSSRTGHKGKAVRTKG